MTREELEERQKWPLIQKIDHALATMDGFIGRLGGIDKVYLSFSGGKDSTVMLDLCRRIYTDILAVFCNTGNEYPEILAFVRGLVREGYNIQTFRPKMTPRQIWQRYGFPLVGKEQAQKIHRIRVNPDSKSAMRWMADTGYFKLAYQWRYLITEPYDTTSVCCDKLKKEPFHRFEKETGRRPIMGIMASESKMRMGQYVRNGGCSVFGDKPACRPLSIWTDDDVWAYIRQYSLPIAEIYNKGAQRTGCVGCGFGAQFKNDVRFSLLYQTHPKLYKMIMDYTNNGITFREALRKVLATNGVVLPDEDINLFNYREE